MTAEAPTAPNSIAGLDALRSVVAGVLIGRNEGARLERTLRAALAQLPVVVYVDSGSRDGSPERARALGVEVIELRSGPYTAARGRQAGLDKLLGTTPGLRYVQFIDGDCVLEPGWVAAAIRFMEEHPRAGAVTGRRREERMAESLYSRLVDVDWNSAPGRVSYPGGDSLCRVDALRTVGGWNPALIAGEDPDLGFRMIAAGWDVHRLPDPMTSHDVAMSGFRSYWRRSVRNGHAYAEVGWMHRRGAGRGWWWRTMGIVLYTAILPALIAVSAFAYWPAAVVLGLLYVRMFAVMVVACRRRGYPTTLSLTYAAFNIVCKFAALAGVLKALWAVVRGRRTVLIEYNRLDAERATMPGAAGG